MVTAEHLVRIRVHVDGELVDEVEFPIGVGTRDLIGELADHHGAICAKAADEDKPYLVELRFWDGEHVRFGTDARGMVWPIATAFDRIIELLGQLDR